MSHYSLIQTEFRDEDILIDTLRELEPGWELELHSTPVNLYGYENDVRPERAHIVIRRQYVGRASNDIGFVHEGNAYRAIISDYDSTAHGSEWLSRLTQLYAKNKVLKQMRIQGWRLGGQTTTEKGAIRLTLEV
jgi:Protein of unknown function (DUF1257)